MNILVIAAHPDDEVLGCGGMVARESTRHAIHLAILGEGLSSRHVERSAVSSNALDDLRADAQAAAAILGARGVEFGGLPDNRFDEVSLLDVIKRVEGWVAQFRPDAIYTHHPGDLNIDHGVTFRAVLTATRPGAGDHVVKDLYAFEVPSSTEWAFQRVEPPFRPTVFVDITDSLDRKVLAMQRYHSEARVSPHPRSPESLRALARYRGAAGAMEYAEAFEVVRSLR